MRFHPRIKSKYRAITLLETVIYLAMFAVLFTTLMEFYFAIGQANQRAGANLEMQRNRIFLTQHLTDTIRNSEGYNAAGSTVDVDSSTLRMDTSSGYLEYSLTDGKVYITDGTFNRILTPPRLELTKFRIDLAQDASTSLYYFDITIEAYDPNIPNLLFEYNLFYVTD